MPDDLHRDLEIPTVIEEIKRCVGRHRNRLRGHDRDEALQLLDDVKIRRRFKRTKPFELV